MNLQASNSRARLEHVEALLRDVIQRDYAGSSKGDAGSLGRMLVHIVNIHHSVSAAPESHLNASKRLGDFATWTDRMASSNPDAAQRLTRLAHALRAARSGMDDLSSAGKAAQETDQDAADKAVEKA